MLFHFSMTLHSEINSFNRKLRFSQIINILKKFDFVFDADAGLATIAFPVHSYMYRRA